MKNNKTFLLTVLPVLAMTLMTGCNAQYEEEEDDIPHYEIGDTVREWRSNSDLNESPLGLDEKENGTITLSNNFGNEDNSSLECSVKGAFISSEKIEKPYFLESDAKNGDVVALSFYLPSDHNVASLQLEVLSIGNFVTSFYGSTGGESVKAEAITINEEKVEKWIRTMTTYDTLETLGAIRLNYTRVDTTKPAHFFVDNIEIIYGAETVKTDYVYNDESLYKTYEDYFKVGTCMSATMMQNTKLRQILVNDFNSVTAENEGKPEQILDQEGCQKLLSENKKAGVAIKTSPFEKLYDFAEAYHIGVRHHTFVWYSQTPSWFFTEDYANGAQVSRSLMLQRMENFIKVTIEELNYRWPGLVYAIDVANEAIDNGIRRNNNNWYSVVGEDFVARAFEYAYKYKEEDQELYYNDYSFDYNQSNCEFAVNTLLTEPIQEHWIDGVGIQGHIDDDQNMDTVINDAKMIKAKGLKCQITELDIETRGSGDNIWTKQKNAYNLLIKRVLESNEKEETDINAVVVWGVTDNLSWKRNNNPLLFDSNYGKKPAYYGFLNALEEYQSNN